MGIGKSGVLCEIIVWQQTTSHGKDAAVNDLTAWGLDHATDKERLQEAERLDCGTPSSNAFKTLASTTYLRFR